MLQLVNKKVVGVLAPLSMGLSVSALAAGAAPAAPAATTAPAAATSPFGDGSQAKAFFIIDGGVYTNTKTKTVTKGNGSVVNLIKSAPSTPESQVVLKGLDSNRSETEIDKTSTHPGGVELGVLTKSWGILANITPDAAGLFGAGYGVATGQYVGLAYSLEASSVVSEGTEAMVGLVGYHILPLTKSQRLTVLWIAGQVQVRGSKQLTLPSLGEAGVSSQTRAFDYKGKGTYLSLNVRYNIQIVENFAFTPSIEYRRTAVNSKFSNLPTGMSELKVDTTETAMEIAPLAFTLNI